MKRIRHMFRCFVSFSLVLILLFGLFNESGMEAVKAAVEVDPNIKSTYDSFMSNNLPDSWNSRSDPYNKGDQPFFLNQQQELFVMKSNGKVKFLTFSSYDNLTLGNTGLPLESSKCTTDSKFPGMYALSYPQIVAFDPTGSGRKDHIAVIGVYASTTNTLSNPPMIYLWVMNKKGVISEITNLGKAKWMTNDSTLNNDNVWDFNAMNFIDITAGDYNGNGKESLVFWACGGTPMLKQVNVTSDSKGISLKVLSSNGYPDADGALMHKPYSDTDDRWVDNRIHADIDTGDLNGDGIDDLVVLSYVNRVTKDYRSKATEYYVPSISVSYGVKGSSTSITKGQNAVRQKYVQKNNKDKQGDSEFHVAPLAAGLAVGDVNGDGKDEAVVAGFYHQVKGYITAEVKNPYNSIDGNKLVVAIYGANLSLIDFETNVEGNPWTRGGDVNGGLYLADSSKGDQSWQRTGVETVAINGPGKAEHIFINGELFTFNSNGNKFSKVYTPDYFDDPDEGIGDHAAEETYIRSMAVGNFTGSKDGYEQIYFVIGGAAADNVGNVTYTMGCIGGVYKKDGQTSDTALDYYCTSQSNIENEAQYYPSKASGSCEVNDCLAYVICAWDNDEDGLFVKYRDKTLIYTDAEVVAILQTAPYFAEMEKYSEDHETVYSISTTYSYDTTTGDSVSFGVGVNNEVDTKFYKHSIQLGYSLGWSKTFTKSLTYSDDYEFKVRNKDQVLIQRTPVTVYNYCIQTDGGFEDTSKIVSISVPDEAIKQPIDLDQYNAFVDYYNSEYIRKAKEKDPNVDVSKLKLLQKINDQFLGHEGDPFSYMTPNNTPSSLVNIQKQPLHVGTGSSSSGYSWSTDHSTTDEETFSHGFSFDYAFGVGSAVYLGAFISLEYLSETSIAETNGNGSGISCTVGNIDADACAEDGIPATLAAKYGFNYRMVKWDSNITNSEGKVPIYGYVLSSITAGAPIVKDLKATSDTAGTASVITLNWTNVNTVKRPITGYVLYKKQDDGTLEQIDDAIGANTTSYSYDNTGNEKILSFVIKAKDPSGTPGLPSNTATVDLDPTQIYSITLEYSDSYYDYYVCHYLDGNTTTIKVPILSSGEDGRELELQVVNGRLQSRYTGETKWKDLVDLSSLKGNDGEQGEPGLDAKNISIQYNSETQTLQWSYEDEDNWTDLCDRDTLKGDKGDPGAKGTDGREPEFRYDTASEKLQWRYKGEETWNDLCAVGETAFIKGEKGDKGDAGANGADGKNGVDGKDGVNGADGKNGREVEFNYNKDTGLLQWRYKGDVTWNDLVAISETAFIRGEQGEKGEKGDPGKDGADGKNGVDGVGVQDVKLDEKGNLIVTLTNGTTINAGTVQAGAAITKTITEAGSTHIYYFEVPYESLSRITVDGKEISTEYYETQSLGDGILVSIDDEAIPMSSMLIEAESTTKRDVAVVQSAQTVETIRTVENSKIPAWMIIWSSILSVWALGITCVVISQSQKIKNLRG